MRVARSGLWAIDYANDRMRGSAATQTKYSGILLNLRT